MLTTDKVATYITSVITLHQNNEALSFAIITNEKLVGRIGLHYINLITRTADIGYWLIASAQGKGTVTACCKVLIHYAFNKMQLHCLQIKVITSNIRSVNIPITLGFMYKGILSQVEFVNGIHHNLHLYSLLSSDC